MDLVSTDLNICSFESARLDQPASYGGGQRSTLVTSGGCSETLRETLQCYFWVFWGEEKGNCVCMSLDILMPMMLMLMKGMGSLPGT